MLILVVAYSVCGLGAGLMAYYALMATPDDEPPTVRQWMLIVLYSVFWPCFVFQLVKGIVRVCWRERRR